MASLTDEGVATKAPRTRNRPPRSCETCRKRKVRCDREHPCRHCVTSKTSCVYNNQTAKALPPRKGPKSVSESTSEQRPLSQTSTEFSAPDIEPRQAAIIPAPNLSERALLPQPNDVQIPHRNNVEHELRNKSGQPWIKRSTISHDLQKAETETSDKTGVLPDYAHPSVAYSQRPLGLHKGRLYGLSHWGGYAHEFKKIAPYLMGGPQDDEATKRLRAEIHGLMQKCKATARSMKSSRPSRCFQAPTPILVITSKHIADQLINLYTTRFESAFRIVHIPSFLKEYEQYWTDPEGTAPFVRLQIQLAAAIGSSMCKDGPETQSVRSELHQWVYAAQQWLGGPFEKDRLTVGAVQIHCLLILARQTLSIGGEISWVGMGTLIRTAMQVGLHRDPKHFTHQELHRDPANHTKLNVLRTEVRRRLWASILELNVQTCLDSGMNHNLSSEDYDTDPPSNINDADLDEDTTQCQEHPDSVATDTSIQRFLLKSLRPRVDILKYLNSIRSEMSSDEVIALSTELSTASRECGSYVPKTGESSIQIFRFNMADMLIRRFLLILHRPYTGDPKNNSLFYFSRKTAFDNAMALLSPTPNEEFNNLLMLGGGIFKNRLIHSCFALSNELLNDNEEIGWPSSPWNISSYRKMLINALKDARTQMVQRMQLGETYVLLHVKTSAILAWSESTVTGDELFMLIGQSARDSLQMAYSIIAARERAMTAALPPEGDLMNPPADTLDFNTDFDFDMDYLMNTADLFLEGAWAQF